MSENESGIKRATEDEQPQSPKKFKLDGEESTTISPISIDNKKEEINKTETPVTVAEATESLGQKNNEHTNTNQPNTDDTSITSEQLLLALTSVPNSNIKSPGEVVKQSTVDKTVKNSTVEGVNTTITESTQNLDPPAMSTEDMINKEIISNSENTKVPSESYSPKPAASLNQGPSLSHATSLALNNLPDISAALRRLSNAGVSASMIEQLSGQANERKTSTEVTPSEILGNALAAVAASARAANNNNTHQSQNFPSSSSNTNNNATTTIGNLAAITANISNILTSSGFHRGSFSQEDTQKLAAAVAGANTRRNSSIAAVGNAFSNMIDQAMMIRRNKVSPKLIIKSEQVWKCLEGIEEKPLGHRVYSPQQLLPNLENCLNGVMQIRVPAKYLTFENIQVKKRAVWGTDIYTDDSDIVAMIIHSGKYHLEYKEPEIEPNDPFALAIAGKPREAMEASKKLALSSKKWIRQDMTIPDHDLRVTVRVLPKLRNYTGSIRYCIKSRDWGNHDGMSLFVNKVEKIKRGDACLKARSSLKSNMFVYEPYRKRALDLDNNKKEEQEEPPIQRGRIKKTQRVIRMFQIRSEESKSRK
ncbi:hypothetical protein G6F57_005728 [Rhizopus arrhizus]|uniref:Uncharacterized protein n=1 Tax=Rhizopus oryzae TaxID=64495 RepID=A0A9P7BQL5_RHIOR|nr:hypothetical protein G6F23_006837 [Rhizopus arrhizus]KAG1419401.1 hypothetical protein G6F58_004626 [Rhizopus delemar]KAG0764270.1 hypothetical protein G6F24_005346 [Rhizopus arrhizus]KAG0790714.1 hypothetical protein G6F21_005608 [Rhizopus arrhizus]KAG0795448.1 hypothetical protein G6F22_005115 [Rhizopus arrhizus]